MARAPLCTFAATRGPIRTGQPSSRALAAPPSGGTPLRQDRPDGSVVKIRLTFRTSARALGYRRPIFGVADRTGTLFPLATREAIARQQDATRSEKYYGQHDQEPE